LPEDRVRRLGIDARRADDLGVTIYSEKRQGVVGADRVTDVLELSIPPDESMRRAVRAQSGSDDFVAIVDAIYRKDIGALAFRCPQVSRPAIAPDVDMRRRVTGIVGCQSYCALIVQT